MVIIGAGFAGLWAARGLANRSPGVLLVDRTNFHTFFPLLYQVAAAELEPEDIAHPVRSILRGAQNVRFALAEVRGVDLDQRTVDVGGESVPYDYLVVAPGSTSHFFGVPGAEEFAFPLRTLEEAVRLRNHILGCFERADREGDEGRRRAWLTFAIVGGGPTGVEFAGALAELIRGSMQRDYAHLDFREVRVVLLEALDSLLQAMPAKLGAYALRRLRKMGVEVRLDSPVARVTADGVELQDGAALPTRTVVWTAGVRGPPALEAWGLPVNRQALVEVDATLRVPGRPRVYVAGDAAAVAGGESVPMLATSAIQEGETVARNILRQMRGEEPLPFEYEDLGTLAVIGRNAGVAHLFGRTTFTGFLAWALWLVIHIVRLIGFRNRFVVLSSWAVDYFLLERAVRLIFPPALSPR